MNEQKIVEQGGAMVGGGGGSSAPDKHVARTLKDFLALELPPREFILEPVIPCQGLVIIFAETGVGKTHVALSMAYAVATGQELFHWKAPKARRVLYVDGEMSAIDMQERLAAIAAGSGGRELADDNLTIITPNLLPLDELMPNLATREGQQWLEPYLDGVELLVLDNLATLAKHPKAKDNEGESWKPVQDWLLYLRRRGITVATVHHAGKSGDQRGTSNKEDVMDTVIALKRPEDYSPEQGARFEVHLKKARGISGDQARPFEAALEVTDGAYSWSTCEIGKDPQKERVRELRAAGMSFRKIEQQTGISKTTAERLAKA